MANLVELISEASEEYWCAGWLSNCEYELWARAEQCRRTGKCSPWGLATWQSTTETVRDIIEVSDAAGVWAMWNPDEGPVEVPLDEWKAGPWAKADLYFVQLAHSEPECGALGPTVPYEEIKFVYFSRCRKNAGHDGECVYTDVNGNVVAERDPGPEAAPTG